MPLRSKSILPLPWSVTCRQLGLARAGGGEGRKDHAAECARRTIPPHKQLLQLKPGTFAWNSIKTKQQEMESARVHLFFSAVKTATGRDHLSALRAATLRNLLT